jgi:hypothetical protein
MNSVALLLISRSSLLRIQLRGSAGEFGLVQPVALPATQPVNAAPIDFRSPVFPVVVTADNWRVMIVRLNNVYTDPAVLAARNQALGQFAAYMEVSDRQTTWPLRYGMRTAAIAKLKESEPDFQRMIQQTAGPARDEAFLALLEIQYNSQEYPAIIHSAPDFIHRMSPGRPRDLAYEYLVQSCAGLRDSAGVAKYRKELAAANPLAEGEFFGDTPARLIASMAMRYQSAQMVGDTALIVPGTPLAAQSLLESDHLRESAAQGMDVVKRLWLQLPQNRQTPAKTGVIS